MLENSEIACVATKFTHSTYCLHISLCTGFEQKSFREKLSRRLMVTVQHYTHTETKWPLINTAQDLITCKGKKHKKKKYNTDLLL